MWWWVAWTISSYNIGWSMAFIALWESLTISMWLDGVEQTYSMAFCIAVYLSYKNATEISVSEFVGNGVIDKGKSNSFGGFRCVNIYIILKFEYLFLIISLKSAFSFCFFRIWSSWRYSSEILGPNSRSFKMDKYAS